jgi:hypothetical protein
MLHFDSQEQATAFSFTVIQTCRVGRKCPAPLLDLRRAESGGNVLLGKPFDSVVFERIEYSDGLAYAKISQVAADVLTGPGRNPAEGEAQVTWMKKTRINGVSN